MKGDKTGRAIMTILRHVGRITEVKLNRIQLLEGLNKRCSPLMVSVFFIKSRFCIIKNVSKFAGAHDDRW